MNEIGTRDVRRHEVGRKLDSRKLEVQYLSDGVDQKSLGQTGHADNETVAANQQREQYLLYHVVLSNDELANFF